MRFPRASAACAGVCFYGRHNKLFSVTYMTENDRYRTSLYERRNNRTGAAEWVIRFVHPTAEYGKFAWFDVPAGHSWFADREDYCWYCSFVSRRKNVAVRFTSLKDACNFLEILKPAEVGEEPSEDAAVS